MITDDIKVEFKGFTKVECEQIMNNSNNYLTEDSDTNDLLFGLLQSAADTLGISCGMLIDGSGKMIIIKIPA